MKNKFRYIAILLSLMLILISCSKGSNSMHLEVDINENIEPKVDQVMDKYIDEIIPGGVVLAAKDGKVVFQKAYGNAQVFDNADFTNIDNPTAQRMEIPRKTELDTLYDMASVTKIMSTTQAIMKLHSEGKLKLEDKVTNYLPDFGKNGKENVKIEQLLTHTSGMPQWVPSFFYVSNDRDKELEFINNLGLIFEPGEHKYSDFGFMTLAYIVEAISGEKFDVYLEKEIYKPLGMKNTVFNPLDKGFKPEQIAATSWGNPFEYRMVDEVNYPDFGYDTTIYEEGFKQFDGWRKEILVGKVNDGNAGMSNNGIAGHAGLFSNANDLAILGQLMLNGGEYKGVKLYDKDTINLFTKNHLGEDNRGFGFELNKTYMGDLASDKTYGHNGFTGTHVYFDPENNIQVMVLTNKQNLGLNEKGSYPGTFNFVKEVSEAIYEELIK